MATRTSNPRQIYEVVREQGYHWVGDGFHVANLLSYNSELAYRLSPFLLLDYHAPYEYSPTDRPRGVGSHPHRGFETVTLSFEGSLAHHDSTGAGGVIHPGDVQWMTAASGILHKEYHEARWAKEGGTMHMVQLWVNLPAADKMSSPGYQSLTADQMGNVQLPDGAGSIRVIAGEHQGVRGPARTFTPINLWDIQLESTSSVDLAFAAGDSTALLVLGGSAGINDTDASEGDLVVFDRQGEDVSIESSSGARLLLLNGEPIDEPIFGHGPFVMNERSEIVQAIEDFNSGKFGVLD